MKNLTIPENSQWCNRCQTWGHLETEHQVEQLEPYKGPTYGASFPIQTDPYLTDLIVALRNSARSWRLESEMHQREVESLRKEVELMQAHRKNDAWYWNRPHAENHLISMGAKMVVVISAEDLRDLIDSSIQQANTRSTI